MVMEPPRRELKHLMKLGIRKGELAPISISTCVWRYCLAPLFTGMSSYEGLRRTPKFWRKALSMRSGKRLA